eukprot:m.235036 g.235036  ORF g.235036 m.235036 type:complete len:145 (+) comp54309_c0_seq5:867-1301(+)
MDRTRLEHALRKDILKPPNKHALESVLSVSLEGQLKSDTDLAKVMQQIATHCPNVVDINFSGPHPGGFKIKDTTPLRLLRHCPKLTTIFLNGLVHGQERFLFAIPPSFILLALGTVVAILRPQAFGALFCQTTGLRMWIRLSKG